MLLGSSRGGGVKKLKLEITCGLTVFGEDSSCTVLINYVNKMQYYAFNVMSKTNLVHDYKYLVSREETFYPLLLFPGTT